MLACFDGDHISQVKTLGIKHTHTGSSGFDLVLAEVGNIEGAVSP